MKRIAFIFALVISTNAYAIGDTERGVLYGLGVGWLYGEVTKEPEWRPGTQYGTEDQFPPFRCSGDSIKCSYERGVYERERSEWEDAKQKAYECGRYGRNCE